MLRYLVAELPRVLTRLAGAVLVYALVTRIPWPADLAHLVATVAAALLGAGVLIICGAFLYNTLFFDHYWRQVDSR